MAALRRPGTGECGVTCAGGDGDRQPVRSPAAFRAAIPARPGIRAAGVAVESAFTGDEDVDIPAIAQR